VAFSLQATDPMRTSVPLSAVPTTAMRWAIIALALMGGLSECMALLRARLRQQTAGWRHG
jgi:hypothetical protein